MLDKKIQLAVNNALKPIEGKLVKMAQENAEKNREAMTKQIELMNNSLEALVEEKVREALKENVKL